MVGHTLHTAFRSWFKDTESDGTPLLPAPLSKKYTVLPQVLGQGSFAVVKACVERATGVERALKIIAKKPLKDSNEQMLKEEIAILGKVEHPNIIKMWDLYESKEGVFIVTDLCRGGELFDQLVEKVHYNELDARHIVRQIFEGVAYLHTHDIIHRDLKPENILLRDKSEHSQIVISDFGLSRFIPDEGLLMTACGSPQYVAPEVLLGKGYGPGVDIWSGGVIAYCLLGGYTPFYGDDQPTLFQQILAMQVEFDPQYWEGISDTAKDFICKCLCPTDKRMTADQALQHPWISDLPKLDHDTPSEHRGVCLKERAKRQHSTRSSLNRAVTAVETVAYLQKLHKLRQDHAQDVQPDKLHALLRVATNISLHRRGDSLMASPLSRSAELPTTNSNGNGNGGFFEGDSAATLTPEPSQMGDSQPPSSKGSRMDVELCIMGGTAPVPSKSGGGGGTASVAAAAAETAHGENPTGNSLGRPIEDDEVQQQQTGQGRVSPTRSQSSSSDVTATPARRASTTKKSSSSSSKNNNNAAAAKSGGSNTLDTLLDQYKTTQIPSSSRVDMTAPSTVPEGMSLAKAWRYVPFLVNQGISIGSAIASHAVYGPAKKSWGIEMSLFTRIMRDASQYTEFATVAGLQSFFDLSSFLPVPKDGLITPVTFRVKKRNLRGMLAEADAKEDGKRELTGEWVVGKQTWRRLQSEWRSGKSRDRERVILYIHGGAYFVMSAATHRPLTISLSKYTECRVFGINYRLAPDTQFPGPLHDVVSAWFRLVDDLGIPPGNIVLGADSAGGGLALALMYYLRDNKYDLPSGAILFSPWVDLTLSCDSWETNAKFDYLPMPASGNHMNPVSAYLGENIDKYITHPYASPLFGDMHGLPPLLIQCGDAEVLRDEVTLLAHKASVAGVAVRHELYEDCVHVFQAFLFLDASRKALQSARHFVRTALDKRGRRKAEQQEGSRKEVDAEMRAGMKNEKGERVEPRTGEREGDWRNTRGAESDSESGARGEEAGDRSNDDDWADFERASISKAASAAAKAPAKVAQKVTGADDASVTRQQREQLGAGANDMRRSQSQPNDGGSPIPSAVRKDSASSTSSSNNARRHRATSSMSMSFSAARDRAEAGMRVQEGPQAPALPKFSDPAPGSVHPRMRRTASSAQVQNLLQGFEQDSSSLHTRVFPATPGA